jgi:hypothetical protein
VNDGAASQVEPLLMSDNYGADSIKKKDCGAYEQWVND